MSIPEVVMLVFLMPFAKSMSGIEVTAPDAAKSSISALLSELNVV